MTAVFGRWCQWGLIVIDYAEKGYIKKLSPLWNGQINKIEDIRTLILESIKEYRREYRFSPTIQEIADDVGAGKAATHYYIQQLLIDGKLKGKPGMARGLVPVDGPENG